MSQQIVHSYRDEARVLVASKDGPLGRRDARLRADEMRWRAQLYNELDVLRHQIAMVEVMLASSALSARTDSLQAEYAEMLERIDFRLKGGSVGPCSHEVA